MLDIIIRLAEIAAVVAAIPALSWLSTRIVSNWFSRPY